MSAVAVRDGVIATVVAAQTTDGRGVAITYLSTNAGTSWTRTGMLDGSEVSVAGAVATDDGFLATGSRLVGTDRKAEAWWSNDGETWQVQQFPTYVDDQPGWSTRLGAPVARGKDIFVPMMLEERLYTRVIARRPQPDGRILWGDIGVAPSWIAPDASALVETSGDGVLLVRSALGAVQLGAVEGDGTWHTVATLAGGEQPVEWWESVGLQGRTPVLVGGHTTVEVGANDWWERRTALVPFRVVGDRVVRAPWRPAGAADLSSTRTVTAPDGTVVLLGERITSSTTPDASDESDVVGWTRPPGGRWTPAMGRHGPRTEFLGCLENLGTEGWFAFGIDRASLTASAGQLATAADRDLGVFYVYDTHQHRDR